MNKRNQTLSFTKAMPLRISRLCNADRDPPVVADPGEPKGQGMAAPGLEA